MTALTRVATPQMVAVFIAAQLRHEAEVAATSSRDFGRGVAHAAATVERIAAAMGRA